MMFFSTESCCLLLALGLFYYAPAVVAHCKVVHAAARLQGSNGGHGLSYGFGLDLYSNRFPWRIGQPGDAGGDSPLFGPNGVFVPNPNPACGHNTLHGPLDFDSMLSQAEGLGVASTTADGVFEALIFQVNRDGGGECTCEYDPTAAGKSWQKCKTLLSPPGIEGMYPADRVNHTGRFQIPGNTVCRGGVFQDKCVIRIRCGFKLRFGGCLALKTPASPSPLRLKVVTTTLSGTNTANPEVAHNVLNDLQTKGVVVPAPGTTQKHSQAAQRMPSRRSSFVSRSSPWLTTKQLNELSLQVVALIKQRGLRVSATKAAMMIKTHGKRG